MFNTACPQVNDMKLYRVTPLTSNVIFIVHLLSNITCWKLYKIENALLLEFYFQSSIYE